MSRDGREASRPAPSLSLAKSPSSHATLSSWAKRRTCAP